MVPCRVVVPQRVVPWRVEGAGDRWGGEGKRESTTLTRSELFSGSAGWKALSGGSVSPSTA